METEMESIFPMWQKVSLLSATLVGIAYATRLGLVRYNRSFQMLLFLATFYPLGKLSQMFVVGPRLIRWYLSDAGFIACTAVTLSIVSTPFRFRRGVTYGDVFLCFAAALTTEWMQIVADPHLPAGVLTRGDWLDVQIYVLTASLCFYLVEKSRN